jgi:hypothetical protein
MSGQGRIGRRQVLGGAGSLAFLRGLPHVSAAEVARARGVPPEFDIEPLVRLLEQTPRDRLLPALAEKIRAGTRYGELLAATFLAGVRGIRARPVGFELHCVLAVHSAHLAALAAPAADRWLPLVWAMDNFKRSQETKRRKGEGAWTLPALDRARLPAPNVARQRLVQAMDAWDEEGADLAVTALARSAPPDQLRELMFRYGARDFRDLGHKAIYAANACRTLDTIGWRHAEPVLRSLCFACLEHDGPNPSTGDAPEDRSFRENLARAGTIRAGWQQGRTAPDAALDLLCVLRKAAPVEASQAVVAMLAAGIDPASVWDGLFLFAAELVLRHAEIVSLHALTTTNALHHAFEASHGDELRRLLLLQAPAFLTSFRSQLHDGYTSGPRIDALEKTGSTKAGAEAIADVFAGIGETRPVAARKALALLDGAPAASPALLGAAQRLVFSKGTSAHDYKFSSAAFEDFRHVSPRFRNRFLAASMVLLPGSRAPDNPLVDSARAALTGA